MKTGIALAVALTTAFLSQGAVACGDSLYRVGKGLSYRTYSAPLPGHLLVLATSDAEKQRAELLAKSGHDVHLVASAEDLADELKNGTFDVVIAPYAVRGSVEAIREVQVRGALGVDEQAGVDVRFAGTQGGEGSGPVA